MEVVIPQILHPNSSRNEWRLIRHKLQTELQVMSNGNDLNCNTDH